MSFATSEGVPKRPIGTLEIKSAICSFELFFLVSLVSMKPGETEFDLIPYGASSSAKPRMYASCAALLTEY
jgi:hypothetical protein